MGFFVARGPAGLRARRKRGEGLLFEPGVGRVKEGVSKRGRGGDGVRFYESKLRNELCPIIITLVAIIITRARDKRRAGQDGTMWGSKGKRGREGKRERKGEGERERKDKGQERVAQLDICKMMMGVWHV
jgi:hypothetical protein